ncbi:Methionyl-tRNA formyltransferase [Paenibacillus allorhizoplanae]|uniref:Methionyl-tRNA formyltransferase n=1 Tax=Paenibacillus allorhizoplanae TaxID=2905648 RepID=A0ABN8GBW4_9BACL|nr:methionyl-tRNA formyltransferase [Paenibacillus allorhizoplanae]CAH1205106.1 Methionyl-tRNA formyltransferase [Paenibacillus allorhizoplanae]
MNIIFMGTPDFAVPSLQALLEEGYNVTTVVTQPDRPKGRKRVLTPTPVKVEAEKHGIPVLQPVKLREADSVEQIRQLAPDLIVTAAYGQILPKSVLDLPKYGCINIHASLLPKYRGGAPIHHAVMRGEAETGVTIMYMAVGLDTGDMISRVALPIEDTDTTGMLFEKLSIAGADLLKRTLPDLLAGRIEAVPQNEADAIYSPNIRREDELLDWSRSAMELWNHIRGLNAYPGAYTFWNGDVLKVWASLKPMQSGQDRTGIVPGTVLSCSEQGIEVMTGAGALWLTEIQPAGKKAMLVSEFVRGAQIPAGTVLGNA